MFPAAYITLRTVVLAELLGIEKLSSSFGIQLLFQGIASLAGAPLAGAHSRNIVLHTNERCEYKTWLVTQLSPK